MAIPNMSQRPHKPHSGYIGFKPNNQKAEDIKTALLNSPHFQRQRKITDTATKIIQNK